MCLLSVLLLEVCVCECVKLLQPVMNQTGAVTDLPGVKQIA